MHKDTIEPFGFPSVGRKKVTAAFDGGRLTSDGGVMLLAAERRIGIAATLAGCNVVRIGDRGQSKITRTFYLDAVFPVTGISVIDREVLSWPSPAGLRESEQKRPDTTY
jgi:hypothetical protein